MSRVNVEESCLRGLYSPSILTEQIVKPNSWLTGPSTDWATLERDGRNVLRNHLLQRRPPFGQTVCPICHKIFSDSADIHEVLLTKARVQGSPTARFLADTSRFNTILVHTPKCHEMATTPINRRLAVAQILFFEGYLGVTEWLKGMANLLDQSVITEALHLVYEVSQQVTYFPC